MPIINTIGNASSRAYGFAGSVGGPILLSASPAPSATVTTYSGYIVFKFTASGTLNVGAGTPGTADVFVVAGGSPGGGQISPSLGGNGGNGGNRNTSAGFSIVSNTPIPIQVGGSSTQSFLGPVQSDGPGFSTGGAGGPANPQSAGGNGPTNNYETGSPQNYGGGGGAGGGFPNIPGSAGGLSGGGAGGKGYRVIFGELVPGTAGSSGSVNTGGGGGGSGALGPGGGAGGSGVVIVRFPDAQFRTS